MLDLISRRGRMGAMAGGVNDEGPFASKAAADGSLHGLHASLERSKERRVN